MHISLSPVSHNRLVIQSRIRIRLNIDIQHAINFELEPTRKQSVYTINQFTRSALSPRRNNLQNLVLKSISVSRRIPALLSLRLDIRQCIPRALNLRLQSLALDLQVGRLLRDAEFRRVESQDLCSMACAVVARNAERVL